MYELSGAIIALTTNILVLWLSRYLVTSFSYWYWGILIFLFGMNVIDLILLDHFMVIQPEDSLLYLMVYHAYAMAMFCALLGLSLEIAGYTNQILTISIVAIAVVNIMLLFVPGMALIDARNIGDSLTFMAGPFLWVLHISMACMFIGSLAVLAYCSYFGQGWVVRRKAFAMLIANAPFTILIMVIVVCMQFGLRIDVSSLISISISFVLLVVLYVEKQQCLIRFLSLIPSTHENRTMGCFQSLLFNPASNRLNEAREQFENALVKEAIRRCNGNKSHAAKMLGISRATVQRKNKQ